MKTVLNINIIFYCFIPANSADSDEIMYSLEFY